MTTSVHDFTELETRLTATCRNAGVHLWPNPGNAGDAVIAAATWRMLADLDITPKNGDIANGDVVLLGGGGNLIPHYRDMRTFLQRALDSPAAHIILLPHTVGGHEDLLTRLDDRCVLYCRDRVSLEHTRRHATRAEVLFAHDLALRLRPAELRLPSAPVQLLRAMAISRHTAFRYAKWMVRFPLWPGCRHGTSFVLRSDIESTHATPSRHRRSDMTGGYRSRFPGEAEAMLVAARIIRWLDRRPVVVTDRLHVALVAGLLGKQVELRDNSYGKNRNVFEASLAGYLPNVMMG
ncbi:MAG: polysaccharide pyruvyl transferase family protein [Phycisphaeraceae bacterium]|nr:polysaccharide pyruvyl transferase family protein [Phycisphaeraceae bacterium]